MADKTKERDPNEPSPSQYEQDMARLGLRPGVDKTPEQRKDEHGNPVGPRMPVPDTEYDKALAAKATETTKPGKVATKVMAAAPAGGYQTRADKPAPAQPEKPKT